MKYYGFINIKEYIHTQTDSLTNSTQYDINSQTYIEGI